MTHDHTNEHHDHEQHGHEHQMGAAASLAGVYTCPMHPEVRNEGPGACPDCGMALEPVSFGPPTRTEYTCPMHPEVRQDEPGACPDCGMALEPTTVIATTRTEYTCPMHPEIVRDAPGECPICGMALEPRVVEADEGPNPELIDMSRRFWGSVVFSTPLLAMVLADMLPGVGLAERVGPALFQWLQFALAAPVLVWAGKPLFERGWTSIRTMKLNMFTLIALGTGVAFVYSAVATLAPGIFPDSLLGPSGRADVYFEAAAIIITLVVLLAKCWNCGRGGKPVPPCARCCNWRPRRRGSCAVTAPRRTSPWSTCWSATACGCAPARRSR